MRKILLATTALVGFAVAGAAQAAPAPLTVTVGGSVDVLAGAFHESKASAFARANDDFETLYSLNFGVAGKAGNGLEYGGNLILDNYPDFANDPAFDGSGNGIAVKTADIFLSGAFGKVVLGDMRGATDLALTAPVVGEGQVYGRYIDFVDSTTLAKPAVALDATDHGTNITYFTPKVGNDMNKVQAGVTFEPKMFDYGSNVIKYDREASFAGSDYKNVIKGALAYTGSFKPVTLGISADILSGVSDIGTHTTKVRDFTAWGVGAQAGIMGFTLGANYLDQGHYGTIGAQNKDQHQVGAGLKYECEKIGVGVSYLGGVGYDDFLSLPGGHANNTGANRSYVKDFNSYGIGGVYTWAPGLTTNADAVLFDQETKSRVNNDGYVLLISQKLAF